MANSSSTSTETVRLVVYDISGGMARQLGGVIGFQIDYIPHTGIVVFGQEYFFGKSSLSRRRRRLTSNNMTELVENRLWWSITTLLSK